MIVVKHVISTLLINFMFHLENSFFSSLAPPRYSDPKAKYGVSVAKKRPAPAK